MRATLAPAGTPARKLATRLLDVDRLLRALTLLFALAVVAFLAYYYLDRRPTPTPGVLERAIAQAEEDVRAEPSSAAARTNLADLYLDRGRHAEAVEQYGAALQADPTLWQPHRGLGLAYLAQGRPDRAETELSLVVDAKKEGEFAAVDRDLAEAYYFRGRARLGLGRADEAIDDLTSALKIDPVDADALSLLGSAFLTAGRPADAAPALQRAVAFVPRFPEAYESLGRAYRELGDPVGERYARAMLLYAAGDDRSNERAIAELQAVVEARPDYREAWIGLGLAHEARRQAREAADAYHRALLLNPSDYNALAGLARLGQSR